MKLLLCKKCNDIFPLCRRKRHCECKVTGGQYYSDGLHACYWGRWAVPLGFANDSFITAVKERTFVASKEFTAFVIEKDCRTFAKVANAKSPASMLMKERIALLKEIS